MMWRAAALFLIGCRTIAPAPESAEPLCRTQCGMVARGNCDELQDTEDAMRYYLDRYVDLWTSDQVCRSLYGWYVTVHEKAGDDGCPSRGWNLLGTDPPVCVSGYAHTEYQMLEVIDTRWRTNALAHEMVHAVDWSINRIVGHCRWKERGIKRTLLEVTGEVDDTPPDPACFMGTDSRD